MLERPRAHRAPRASAPTCCCGRSCRTRCSPRSVTSAGRASWPTSPSSKDIYASFGVPMPLIHPRATLTLLDANALQVPHAARPAARDAAGAGRVGAERAARGAAAAGGGGVARTRRCDRSRSAWRRWPRPSRQVDPTLEGAARSTLGRMQDDLKKLQAKIIQAAKRKDETLRRQFKHAQAQAFPGGAPAGARARLRLLPQQVRAGARRAAVRGAAARPGAHWVMTP